MGIIRGSSFLKTKKKPVKSYPLPGHFTSKTPYPSLCIYQMKEQAGKMGWFPGCFHSSHDTCDGEGRNTAAELEEMNPSCPQSGHPLRDHCYWPTHSCLGPVGK